MTGRLWKPGDRQTLDGIPFRVVPGRKVDRWKDDMRGEFLTEEGWRPVTMATSFALASFHYTVEQGLYPPPAEGGEYFVRNLTEAARGDWQVVRDRLQEQRRAREERGSRMTASVGNTTWTMAEIDEVLQS